MGNEKWYHDDGTMVLQIDTIDFAAGHFLPGHEKGCGSPHGHNYVVEDLKIYFDEPELDSMGILVDFGVVKGYFKQHWNHRNLVPNEQVQDWVEFYEKMDYADNLKGLLLTSVEYIGKTIKLELAALVGVNPNCVHFTIYETGGPELPGMGVSV